MPHSKISRNKTLHHSLKDGAFYSFMVGTGEAYMAAFVLALGFGQVFSGMITVFPMLIGATTQLLTAFFKTKILMNQKKWVVSCVITQGLSLILISTFTYTKLLNSTSIFILISIYWAAGLAAGATWNIWLGEIIPKRIRFKFFSYRSQICHSALLIGLVAAGVTLHFNKDSKVIIDIFGSMFLIAGVSRLFSAFYLSRHSEKTTVATVTPDIPSTLPKIKEGPILTLLLYLFLLQTSAYISSPYLNPYMLKQLHIDYWPYMILISSAFIARVMSYKFFGELAKKRGPNILLLIGSVGIIPLPAFWLAGNHFFVLLLAQLLSGIFWSAHEMGVFFILLNKYKAETRAKMLTFIQFLNAFGMFLGSTIGGIILQQGELSLDSYYKILMLSALARATPLLILPKLMSIRFPKKNIHKLDFLVALDKPKFQSILEGTSFMKKELFLAIVTLTLILVSYQNCARAKFVPSVEKVLNLPTNNQNNP